MGAAIIAYSQTENLFFLSIDKIVYATLRSCGHMCSVIGSHWETDLVAMGCVQCDPKNHARDCIVCSLLTNERRLSNNGI